MFNYRDLGGHPALGGHLKTGLLYRSDAVAGLDADAEPATVGPARGHELPVIDADPAAPYTLAGFTRWLVESRGNAWADAARYLRDHGLSADDLELLRKRLVADA